MSEPRASLQLLGSRRRFAPRETLALEYRLAGVAPGEIQSIEISVLWHTEGKGDEDLAVHFFERLEAQGEAAPPHWGRVECPLPASPLTYQGVIVKLRWCARIRAFLANGRELVDEQMFQLGDVAAARALPS